MGSEKSISVIVMRDQGRTFSLRFSPNTFRFFLSTLIIVPILLGLTIWFSLSIYQKYVTVLDEAASLKQKMEKNRQTVTRLANLERFLEKYSPNMLGLLVSNEHVALDKLPVFEGDKEFLVSEMAKRLVSDQMSFDIIDENKQVGKEVQKQEKENIVAEKQSDIAKKNLKEEKEKNTVLAEIAETKKELLEDLPKQTPSNETEIDKDTNIRQQVDLDVVSVEKLSAKIAANVLSVKFQLANKGKYPSLNGSQKYYISSIKNGKVDLFEISNASDMTFKIKNLKIVKSSAEVAGLNFGKNPQFMMEIIIKGETVFRKSYPLTQ